jgi:hypothetical protein
MVRQVKKNSSITDWTAADHLVKGELASPSKKRKSLEDSFASPKQPLSSGEDDDEEDPQQTSRAQNYIFKRDICFFICICLYYG